MIKRITLATALAVLIIPTVAELTVEKASDKKQVTVKRRGYYTGTERRPRGGY